MNEWVKEGYAFKLSSFSNFLNSDFIYSGDSFWNKASQHYRISPFLKHNDSILFFKETFHFQEP